LFDAAPNPYVIFDLDLVIVGANQAYLAVTGRRREDIVGRHVFDAFPSDPTSPSGRMLRNSLAKVLRDRQPDQLALIPYSVPGDGQPASMRYWSATHTPVFDQAGEMAFILQHTTDVTEIESMRNPGLQEQAGLLQRAAAVQAENEALSRQAQLLRGLFQQAPSFMAMLAGPNHVFELVNDAYAKMVAHRSLIGVGVAEALPEVVEQGFIGLLDGVYKTGIPYIGRAVPIMLQQQPGAELEQAYLDFIYQPIRDASGDVVGIFVQGHDITDQKAAEAALARQTDFLTLAQEAGGIGTFEWDLQTNIVRASRIFRALYGLEDGPEQIPAETFGRIVHPEDRDRLATSTTQSVDDGVRQTEYRVITDQGIRWIGRRGVVLRDAEGKPSRVMGAVYDLTERKEAEAQVTLLAQESAHRIKNMLSMIQAIATQTLRNSATLVEARDAIGARLVALGQAQDLLTHGSGTAAGLRDVVIGATRLHSETFGRITVQGPNEMLEPKAVLGLGLMLHELSTNAVKYGALSVPEGRVQIVWGERQDATMPYVDWQWREIGGPPVAEPSRKGFGSRMIERGLTSNLGHAVTLDYAPSGLVCTARIAVR